MNRTATHTACTDAYSVTAHTLNSMITFHHANTRGSRAHSSGLHAVVSQKVVCHQRVMSHSGARLRAQEEKGNTERCEYHSQAVANYARRFPRGRWSFLGLGSEKKWYGTYSDKPDGAWDKTAEQMMLNFAGTSHPMCSVSTEQ